MIRKSSDKEVVRKPAPFNGTGEIQMANILNSPEEMQGKGRVFAQTTVFPGSAIGYHVHQGDGETYYILSGRGKYSDNGTIIEVGPGDVVVLFSFAKLHGVDTHLGPEMKSTGEVLGIGKTLDEALLKGLVAAGYKLKRSGGVFISVRDTDKPEIIDIADKFASLGFELYATSGTANKLNRNFIAANAVRKISEDPENNVLTLLDSGKIDYVISTSAKGRQPARDSVKIRRKAVERSIACLTSLDTANALADCLLGGKNMNDVELVDITKI